MMKIMSITKAIIPIAGWGTRRLPITKVIEKSMLPIGNRPIVDYVVEDCVKAGIKDIYLVIGEGECSQVKAYYGENLVLEKYLEERGKGDRIELMKTAPKGVNFHYVVQKDDGRYGTALPVAIAAEEFGIDEAVAVLMGDDFIWEAEGGSEMANLIASVESEDESAIVGATIAREDVSKYGVLEVVEGKLAGIVEKPSVEEAPSSMINISKYVMSAEMLRMVVDYVKGNDFGPKDQEYMITDPIFDYIRAGNVMRVLPMTGRYLDGGSLEGWLEANNVVCGSY
ncbi:sugar phosphate nucleotidyltransferase [Candidatus Saccharibacteria bacterium]|nr:sugar phosphate nucleotidyltransferase [Candidatus Saccharibacteria bacterium]